MGHKSRLMPRGQRAAALFEQRLLVEDPHSVAADELRDDPTEALRQHVLQDTRVAVPQVQRLQEMSSLAL